MKRNTPLAIVGFALAGGALLPQSSMAGSIGLYEIATPDLGLASAGYAARADDASTLFKNPAGMSLLEGTQVQGGLQALYGSVSFTPDANTSTQLGTDDGGNALGWLPGGSLFVVAPLGEKWRVGFGMLSYFGLAEDYNDNWVGRYYVQESALLGMSLTPSLSFQATDWLSIGAGLNAMYGYQILVCRASWEASRCGRTRSGLHRMRRPSDCEPIARSAVRRRNASSRAHASPGRSRR